jgi:hypothetical protein
VTVNDLDTIVQDQIDVSRPTTPSQRLAALNVGLEKFISTVLAVRPETFTQEAVVTLPANRLRVPMSSSVDFPKPVERVLSIESVGANGPTLDGVVSVASARPVAFHYCSSVSPEFAAAQRLGACDRAIVFYDVNTIATVPTLLLAPALGTPLTVLFRTIYRPLRFTFAGQTVEPFFERYQEGIVAFAMHHLLRNVNDQEANSYQATAEAVRGEMAARLELVSHQNIEEIGSGLLFGDV